MSTSISPVTMPQAVRANKTTKPLRISHVINTLTTGGAERMLLKLIGAMDRNAFQNSVIALGGEGTVSRAIRELGISVRCLDLQRGSGVQAPFRLARELNRQEPDLIQTWMYHSDLLGSIASLALPGVPVIWNIRTGRLQRGIQKQTTIWISRACAVASHMIPSRIVCCSDSAAEAHVAAGYASRRMYVAQNGFDTDAFRPDARLRRSIREELNISDDEVLAGMIARFDPAKDHKTFFDTARRIAAAAPHVRFVLCGEGATSANPAMVTGLGDRCRLLGRRDDMPRIMAGLDLAISSSIVEGFPNVVGEAMSCCVPYVATDAGECRSIIGATGSIVPVRDPAALAAAVLDLVNDPARRARLGAAARQRIIDHFSLTRAARRYEAMYREVARCAA